MNRLLTEKRLRKENLTFVGTAGVSAGNRATGLLPAFLDTETGRAEISRFADGRPAPLHLLDGLPAEWVVARDGAGRVTAIKESVEAGFVRNGHFYTRAQAAALHQYRETSALGAVILGMKTVFLEQGLEM